MFCTSCGENGREDAQFCRKCGAALTNPLAQPPSITEAQTAPLPRHESDYYSPLSEQQNNPPNYTAYFSPNAQAQNPLANPSYADYRPPLPNSASGRATASLVISIISLFTCTLLSILGMILGKMEMNDIKNGRAPSAGMGYAKAGFWIGAIITGLQALGIVIAIFVFFLSLLFPSN